MKLLAHLLGLFVPRETAESDAGGEGGGDPQPQGGSDPEGRPNWLPEKFWDQDVGIRAQPLAEAYSSLEQKLRDKTENLKKDWEQERLANVPEKYEIPGLPEDLEIPEGMEVNLKEDDPMVNWFFDSAKQWGLNQDQVAEAVNAYIKMELEAMPNPMEEIKKLGDYGADRVQKVENYLRTTLDEGEFAAVSGMLANADSIKALEKLMKKPGPQDFDGDGGAPALTLGELRQMQNDPRYWRDKDPEFISKVQNGYQRLYGK